MQRPKQSATWPFQSQEQLPSKVHMTLFAAFLCVLCGSRVLNDADEIERFNRKGRKEIRKGREKCQIIRFDNFEPLRMP